MAGSKCLIFRLLFGRSPYRNPPVIFPVDSNLLRVFAGKWIAVGHLRVKLVLLAHLDQYQHQTRFHPLFDPNIVLDVFFPFLGLHRALLSSFRFNSFVVIQELIASLCIIILSNENLHSYPKPRMQSFKRQQKKTNIRISFWERVSYYQSKTSDKSRISPPFICTNLAILKRRWTNIT